jgi:transposase
MTMNIMIPPQCPVYIGVDVAKAELQVDLRGAEVTFGNTPAGRLALCKKLRTIDNVHVICEATGGYEQPLGESLHKAQIVVSVINPAQVRAAAQAKGQRAKTDAIDARMLTEYGQRYQPEPTPPLSKVQRQLVALTQWLQQLVEAQAVAKAQAEHHADAFVRKHQHVLLEHYESQIEATEAKLHKLLQTDHQLQQRAESLDAIKGVGLRTALLMLSHMPELGHLNRQEVAALAGLAPWTRDSGTLKGIRCIGGGRPEVRVALYMSALCAARHNPILREFYQRLIAKGKPAKVALTAVMRKLVVYMNHKLKALNHEIAASQKHKKSA